MKTRAKKQIHCTHAWQANEELSKDFIYECLGQIAKCGYLETSLQTQSWAHIRETLSKKYPEVFNNVHDKQKFIKNRWNILKKKYSAYRYLLGQPDNHLNSETGLFGFSEDRWKYLIERNKDCGQFRKTRLEYANELHNMFDAILATKENAGPNVMINVADDVVEVEEKGESDFVEDTYIPRVDFPTRQIPTTPSTPIAPTNPASNQCCSRTSKRKMVESIIDPMCERMCGMMERYFERDRTANSGTAGSSVEPVEGPESCFTRCMALICAVRTVLPIDNDTIELAIMKLSKTLLFRKQFLALEDNDQRTWFLRALAKSE